MFLESYNKKSSSNRSITQRVFNCSTLVLALHKLTNIKGTSSIVTSMTRILPLLSLQVLLTDFFFVVINPRIGCTVKKGSYSLNSLCHSF